MLIQIKNEQKLGEKNILLFCLIEDFFFRSQVLILPPYQRKGHGRRLLTAIYNDLREDSRVQDIKGII